MGDVAVLETAQHVDDGVDFADIGEELVAETLAFRGAADEAGDIDEFQAGRDDLDRLADLRQHVQTRVRHADATDVRLDRAERIIGRLRRGGRGQRVEQGRFADIGQADDAAVETHLAKFLCSQRDVAHEIRACPAPADRRRQRPRPAAAISHGLSSAAKFPST